jgi:hypothetical protein
MGDEGRGIMHKSKRYNYYFDEEDVSYQYPEAYQYMKYLMRKHGIKRERLQKRGMEAEQKITKLQKIPQKEYREIEMPLKNHFKRD